MEEEKYPGKNLDVDTLPEEELLSDLGKNDRLEICWTSTRFKKPDNWTPYLAENKATRRGVAMSVMGDSFYVVLDEDLNLLDSLRLELSEFYGRFGSEDPSE